MSTKAIGLYLFVAGLTAIFLLGVGVRRSVFVAQEAQAWDEVPYTLESALHFRMIKGVVQTGDIPETDKKVGHPDGIDVSETYSIGDEWVFAGLSRLFPDSIALPVRLRWISVLWFCLGIVFISIWIACLLDCRWAGCVAGLFYAVMPASVVRSTGQELSRENFALPLLLAHLAMDALVPRLRKPRSQWLAVVASSLLLAAALCTWDLIRFYIIVLFFIEAIRLVASRQSDVANALYWKTSIQAFAVLAAGFGNPYLRSHAFLSSPVALLGLGLILAKVFACVATQKTAREGGWASSKIARLAILFLPLILVSLFSKGFSEHYGHFWDLLLAKIRFMNVKPSDPGLLGFDASILWVPALHSASAKTVFSIFPLTLFLTFGFIVIHCRKFFSSNDPDCGLCRMVVFYAVTFISFLLFVRFHVLLAIFTAGIMGSGACFMARGRRWRAVLAVVLAVVLASIESYSVWREPGKWGRPGVYYSEMKELVEWINRNLDGEPVLANFGISSAILTYAGNPIVLHPKFEKQDIREEVREYGTLMFKGKESDLREWMEARDVRYLVYSMGEFSDIKPEWQMRYFVDALRPPPNAPARLFEFRNEDLNIFEMLWSNGKYRVFKMRTSEDESRAGEMAERAAKALQQGQLQSAENLAAKALLLYPRLEKAKKTLRHVGALKDAGVRF